MQIAIFINQEAATKAAVDFDMRAWEQGLSQAKSVVRPVYGRGCQLLGWGVKCKINRFAEFEWVMEE